MASKKLEIALERLAHERLGRGRGARALQELRRRIHAGEVQIDETTELLLTDIIESAAYELQDRSAEARRNLQVTSRTISHAIRRGGR